MFAEKYKEFKPLIGPSADYEWLEQQYPGKSVALLEGEVIAFNDDPYRLWKEIRYEYPSPDLRKNITIVFATDILAI